MSDDRDDEVAREAEADLTRWCLALLTMRTETPTNEWFDPTFERVYEDGWREATAALGIDQASETAVLDLVNMAELLIEQLAKASGLPAEVWLTYLRDAYVDPTEENDA